MDIYELLKIMVERHASDLHLSSGVVPRLRIDNDLVAISEDPAQFQEILMPTTVKMMLAEIVPAELKMAVKDQLDVDFSFAIQDPPARFRANVFHQERGISIAIRHIPIDPPSLEELQLPPICRELCDLRHGLVVVTGPTGSGKSTTLAAMVNYINSTYQRHILTIEDPIEYIHQCKRCLIQQREVQRHTRSFDEALRAALREDPNYVLVGEMRDLETIRLALTAAETGSLVLATLHTNSAADTVDRIVDVFPSFEKSLIRSMVANSLMAVISQRLLKKIGGGRVAAEEIMVCTPAIRNLIRENKIHQIYSAIQTGRAVGMQTLAYSVKELINRNIIDEAAHQNFLEN